VSISLFNSCVNFVQKFTCNAEISKKSRRGYFLDSGLYTQVLYEQNTQRVNERPTLKRNASVTDAHLTAH